MRKITLNSAELAYFCTQMNLILNSGLSVQEGIEVLLEDAKGGADTDILKKLNSDISNKKNLYVALKNSGAFPVYVINMVRIGELSGRLEEVFLYLAGYYENDTDMKKNIKSVVFQPIILLCMMFLVVSVLVAKVIPIFIEIFNRVNVTINESFNKIMEYSTNMGIAVLIVLAIIICVCLLIILLVSINTQRNYIFSFLDSCYFTRGLMLKFARARFAKAMAVMMKSGLDTMEAIEYAQDLVLSKKYRKKLENCHKRLLANESFVDCITGEGLFTNMYNQMLKVAYKTGEYEITWDKISDMHSEDLNDSVVSSVQLIEPIIVTVLTVAIGGILIAVMLPLIGIMNQI